MIHRLASLPGLNELLPALGAAAAVLAQTEGGGTFEVVGMTSVVAILFGFLWALMQFIRRIFEVMQTTAGERIAESLKAASAAAEKADRAHEQQVATVQKFADELLDLNKRSLAQQLKSDEHMERSDELQQRSDAQLDRLTEQITKLAAIFEDWTTNRVCQLASHPEVRQAIQKVTIPAKEIKHVDADER